MHDIKNAKPFDNANNKSIYMIISILYNRVCYINRAQKCIFIILSL